MIRQRAANQPDYSHRLARLRQSLQEAGVDALLVTSPPNLRYLVGFDGSMGALLVSADAAVLAVDGRYVTSVRDRVQGNPELKNVSVALVEGHYEESIARIVIGGPRIWNLGVEAHVMTLSRFDGFSEALGRVEAEAPGRAAPRLRGTERVVERIRLIKDAAEIETFREAAARLSEVAREVPSFVRPGRTERDIAADIDSALQRAGFERPAFETIVASGPNSALPHARPSQRVLGAGDGVVLDFGGVYDGYCVDLTRTVELAPGTDRFAQLFEAVRLAHAAAVKAVRPGVKASEVDGAARQVLIQRGLGDAFVHGTGHGLGLEVHEEPRISKAGSAYPDETLVPGMVFTIEPGAYVPGVGGVRIEDDVLVVDEGCEMLTNVPIDRTGPRLEGPAGER